MTRIRLPIVASLLLLLCVQLGVGQLLGAAAEAGGPYIRLKAAAFDPLQRPFSTAAGESDASTPDDLYLLQFVGPVQREWKAAVVRAGTRLYGYVPDYAFLARMDQATVAHVKTLSFVRWAGPYLPAYRISPGLAGEIAAAGHEASTRRVVVRTLPDSDVDRLVRQIDAWNGTVFDRRESDVAGMLGVALPGNHLQALAEQPGVVWVEAYVEPHLFNDQATGEVMQVDEVRDSLGLFGASQIVAIADAGLDVGELGPNMSDDFEGRIVSAESLCEYFGLGSDWSDRNGHGTHVAGSLLGNGSYSGSSPETHDYAGSFAGVAPEARLVFQAIDSDGDSSLECVPFTMDTLLFGPAYDEGARIHSNSWGGPSGGTNSNPEYGGYSYTAEVVDEVNWMYKDLTIVFAAGNAGEDANADGVIDEDSTASPATAKNVISVGASENLRPLFTSTWGQLGYPADPIRSDRLADSAEGLAAFSGRGPTDDGRIKPEIVAPGTWIVSARSHHPDAFYGWGTVGPHYAYNSGTSMATPLTAGAAALVREWLIQERGICTPSSALVKGVLLNGAADITPGQYGTGSTQEIPDAYPNTAAGWGRVDVANSVDPPAPTNVWFRDHRAGLQTGETQTYQVALGDAGSQMRAGASELRATLLWTDYPGQSIAEKALVNDLDLELDAPGGARYYGNQDGQVPSSCRSGNADRCNNVESLRLANPATGTYTLTVRAHNVPYGPQPFALVVSGDSVRTSESDTSLPGDPASVLYLPLIYHDTVCP